MSARSHARLQRVLRVRHVQEEVARARWLAAERAARIAGDARADADARRADAACELRDALADLTPAAILRQHAALDALAGVAVRLRERARTLRFQADRERAPWELRRREARGLERLCERSREEAWLRALAREARELDEIAGARAFRARQGVGRR